MDSCSKGNPELAGGGGIIRSHNDNLLKAFFGFYGQCTNNIAEAKAILQGLHMFKTMGLTNVMIESDSLIVVNMINKRSQTY